jgi:tetratricopeptide (TPR) repeat protein
MAVSSGVLKRFIVYLAVLTVATFLGWDILRDYVRQEPGNYDTKRGDQLLTAEDYEEALVHFNLALEESPNHRGALMGRALVYIATERQDEAIVELDYLIDHLVKTLEPDDKTGIGTLAAAHANRGILYDRRADYERALEDYIESLKVDEEAVEGPGVIHEILYDTRRPSTVRDRARYIYEQLQLPEDQRLLSIPEFDDRQRMYKP